MASVRGSALREFLRFYGDTGDASWVGPHLARHPLADGSGLTLEPPTFGFLPNQWYDVALVTHLCDELERRDGAGSLDELARHGARHAVAHQIDGIYRRVLSTLVSPALYARSIPSLFRLLHDTGRREVRLDERAGIATSVIGEWGGHHPFLCRATHELMAAVFEQMGRGPAVVEALSCVSTGSPRCVARVRYRAER